MRPEILLAALDRFLLGQEISSEERPIVSTGIQDLVSIKSYRVERVFQMVEDENGSLVDPLGSSSLALLADGRRGRVAVQAGHFM